jgi:hypothetical protein
MTINDVLQSVTPILERLQELAPIVYAIGTRDKAAMLIQFPEATSYEKEADFSVVLF